MPITSVSKAGSIKQRPVSYTHLYHRNDQSQITAPAQGHDPRQGLRVDAKKEEQKDIARGNMGEADFCQQGRKLLDINRAI